MRKARCGSSKREGQSAVSELNRAVNIEPYLMTLMHRHSFCSQEWGGGGACVCVSVGSGECSLSSEDI